MRENSPFFAQNKDFQMAHILAHISAYFDCLSPAQLESPQGQPGLCVAQ
jgi:hypothetical protein